MENKNIYGENEIITVRQCLENLLKELMKEKPKVKGKIYIAK